MRLVFGLTVLFAACALSFGQWGGRACCGPQLSAPAYEWVRSTPNEFALFYGGRQVGAYREGLFRPLSGDAWGAPCAPPIDPPSCSICGTKCPFGKCDSCTCATGELPTGVVRDKIAETPRLTRSGSEISAREAKLAIEESALKDDSGKRRIVVIGKNAKDRDAALKAIGKPEWAIVQSRPSDHWQVKDGFKTDGEPTIYILERDGTPIHRQDDLKDLDIAIRRGDPKYDPKDDPDLRKPTPLAPDLPKTPVPAPPLPSPAPIAPKPVDPPSPAPVAPDANSGHSNLCLALVGGASAGLMSLLHLLAPMFLRWLRSPGAMQTALLELLTHLKAEAAARAAKPAEEAPQKVS